MAFNTFTADGTIQTTGAGFAPQTVSGATKANPCVLTITANNFSNGDIIYVDDVDGMVELNGNTYTVANKAANTVELSGIDSTGYTTYSGTGFAYHTDDWIHGTETDVPVACITFQSRANALPGTTVTAMTGVGFSDGTDDHCVSIGLRNGQSNSDSNCRASSAILTQVQFDGSAGIDGSAINAEFIAGGVRAAITNTAGGLRKNASLFFADCEAKVLTATMSTTNTVNVDPGIDWDVVFMASVNGAQDASLTTGRLSFGWYDKTAHASIMFAAQHAAATAAAGMGLQVSDDYACGQVSEITGALQYGLTAAQGSGTSCDITPSASAGSDIVYCLFLGGVGAATKSWTTPTSTGSNAQTGLGLAPLSILNIMSFAATLDTAEADADAGAFGFSVSDSAEQYSVAMANEYHASGSTDSQGSITATAFDLPPDDATTTQDFIGTLTSLDSSGFTHNFTAVDTGTARQVMTIGFASSQTPVTIVVPTGPLR